MAERKKIVSLYAPFITMPEGFLCAVETKLNRVGKMSQTGEKKAGFL